MEENAVRRNSLASRALGALALATAAALAPVGALDAQEPAGEPLRVAIVNLDSVAASSAAGRALQARLDELQARVQRIDDSLQAAVRQVEERVAAAPDTLPEEDRAALEREYFQTVTALQTHRQEAQREAQQMRAEGFGQISDELDPVLRAVHEEGDYDLVLNANSTAIILFGDRLDITAQVIARLNGGG